MPKAPFPETYAGLPAVTAARMKRLDAIAESRGLKAMDLMENAGRGVAREAVAWLKARGLEAGKTRVVVCCGRGANGGDGLVAARYLAEEGATVEVFIAGPKKGEQYSPFIKTNVDRARSAGVSISVFETDAPLNRSLEGADVVLDALLGTGSAGKPAGAVKDMIQAITRSRKPVLAVDIPSGLHPDTGHHSGVFVAAAATFTLALPKRGLLAPHAKKNVGELKVLDIGFPPDLLK